jgi:GT2 family glycosyltransferase
MNLLVRRDDDTAVSGFNEDLITAEDVDLCYRLGQRGTVLYNAGMEAIHWGEAGDLRTFLRKEVWRGMGNLKGILSHGLRWDELPSLGYPLYIICIGLTLWPALFIAIWRQQSLWFPLWLVFLCLPALLLAAKTAWQSHRLRAMPKLFLLYLLYGVARAYAIIKAWTG